MMEPLALAVTFALFAAFAYLWTSVLYSTLRKKQNFWTSLYAKLFALFSLLLFFLLLLYAFFIEPRRLTLSETEIKLNLKTEIESEVRIAHISDLHYEGDSVILEKILSVIREKRPDIVCISGDYFNRVNDSDVKDLRSFIETLSKNCKAVLSVSGNWDEPLIMERLFENAPGNVFHDTFVYEYDGFSFVLLPFGFERFVGDFTLKAQKSTVKILLTHSPDLADDPFVNKNFHLYLCGHTHGGQVRLPLVGAPFFPSKTARLYQSGLYRMKSGMFLYVNRGVGMTKLLPKLRLFSPPEISLIKLSY
ncbi:MAG: metallophosphoesterase [Planctomycetota bacterium]|nr:metallophosphoesterase [Planctomycetota bacterium]